MLGHVGFWDGRALSLAEKLVTGAPFAPADHEPEDVDPINAAVRALLGLMPRRAVGRARGSPGRGDRPPGRRTRSEAAVARGSRVSSTRGAPDTAPST